MSATVNYFEHESRLLGDISVSLDMQMTPPLWKKVGITKESLDEAERVSLKHNIQKTKIMASSPITSWNIDGETTETVDRVYFLGL